MIRLLFSALVFLLVAVPVFAAGNRSGAVVVEVDLSAQPLEQTRLWLPYPVSDRHQLISDLRIVGDYAAFEVTTDRQHGTPILYAEWPKEAKSRKLSLSFNVQRDEVLRRDLPAQETPWDRSDYAEYLGATRLGPVDGAVQKLAEKITRGKSSVLAKSRAIYDWVCDNMYRDPATVGCGKGDVCFLLQKPGGKCTDISSVFVALSRAAGVPAREIFGVRLGKKAEEDITGWQHCWAEFYLPGTGWVPVDPADVRKMMLVEKLAEDDPKAKEYREYFWGGLDPYRFRVAVGRDLMLNPPQAGPPLNTFGYPYAEVGGTPLDWYDAKSFSYRISYRETP